MRARKTLIVGAAFASLVVAGCGASQAASSNTTPATTAAAPATTAAPPSTPTAAQALKISPVSCGLYTAAQQVQFSTNAAAGAVFTITNETSGGMNQPLQVDVNFVHRTTVDTSNVNGSVAPLASGQSEEISVDNLIGSANGNSADTCQVTGYGYTTTSGQWVTSGSASS